MKGRPVFDSLPPHLQRVALRMADSARAVVRSHHSVVNAYSMRQPTEQMNDAFDECCAAFLVASLGMQRQLQEAPPAPPPAAQADRSVDNPLDVQPAVFFNFTAPTFAPAPTYEPAIKSGEGGDFAGAGASGSWEAAAPEPPPPPPPAPSYDSSPSSSSSDSYSSSSDSSSSSSSSDSSSSSSGSD